jgi:hypothetical protein
MPGVSEMPTEVWVLYVNGVRNTEYLIRKLDIHFGVVGPLTPGNPRNYRTWLFTRLNDAKHSVLTEVYRGQDSI